MSPKHKRIEMNARKRFTRNCGVEMGRQEVGEGGDERVNIHYVHM